MDHHHVQLPGPDADPRGYDQTQWNHAFGLSGLYPLVQGAPVLGAQEWYWGSEPSTTSTFAGIAVGYLASAIHYAGPDLTAKNVQKGFFSIPARGGAASDLPTGPMSAFGKTAGLPYDSYMNAGGDAAVIWYDSDALGASQVRPTPGKGVTYYVDNAKRYKLGTFPKKTFAFFDKAGAVDIWATPPVPVSPTAPCAGCPSQGGTDKPASA